MTSQQLLPLARSQRDLWMAERVSGPSSAYSMMACTTLRGPVNKECWQQACQHVLSSTQALRLKIVEQNTEVGQVIRDELAATIRFCDVSTAESPELEAEQIIKTLLETPFTTADEQLFRWGLIKQTDDHYYYVEAYHHIILDGFCGWQVSERIKQTYANLAQDLMPPKYDYQGLEIVLAKESAYLATEQCKKDRAFWLEALLASDSIAKAKETQLSIHSADFHRVTVSYDDDETQKIRSTAEQLDTTPANLITAAAALMVSLQQNSAEAMLGTMQLGRSAKSAADDPLFMANRSCLLFDTSPNVLLSDLVAQVKTQIFRSLRRQNYRYEDLRHDLGLSGQNPDPFELIVNNMPFIREVPIPGLSTKTTVPCYGPVSGMGLSILEAATENQISFVLDGNTKLYSRQSIRDYAQGLDCIVRALLSAAPDTQISRIVFTDVPFYEPAYAPCLKPVNELLRHSFEIHADLTAIVTASDGSLTYRELDRDSNAIANRLIEQGVCQSSVVAVSMSRRPILTAALIGVIKSGAICLPLDANYPAERTRLVLQESGADILIIDDQNSQLFAEDIGCIIPLNDSLLRLLCDQYAGSQPPDPATRPEDIVSLTFTSGSTGKPKGVPITHRALSNRLLSDQSLLGFDSASCLAHTASFVFDAALYELLIPLVVGGSVVLYRDEEVRNFDSFWGLVSRFSATHLSPAPTLASSLLRKGMGLPPSVRVMLLGGEVLPTSLAADYIAEHAELQVFNLYGPAEACIQATCHLVNDLSRHVQPIGQALPGCEVYVLDAFGRRVPPGVVGEICIGGLCLMPGYWKRPDLTAQKFIPNCFGDGSEFLYRTGDIASIGSDGLFYFVGRNDRVVKRNGVRIEIGDIEHSLNLLDGIGDAAVFSKAVGMRKLLIGYATLEGELFSTGAEIKRQLAKLLPSTMLPDAILILDEMPRLPSGKINYNALPDPDDVYEGLTLDSPLQQILADIFCFISGVQPQSIDQSLFDLGGDSLAILRLEGEIFKRLDRQMSLHALFADPTIRSISSALESDPAGFELDSEDQVVLVNLSSQYVEPQICCIPAVSGLATIYQPLAHALADRAQLFGLQAQQHQLGRSSASLSDLASIYADYLVAHQRGSALWLLGWSFGGVVAHELAVQLERRQQPIAGLILLDSYFDASCVPADSMMNMTAFTPKPSSPAVGLEQDPSFLLRWQQRMAQLEPVLAQMLASHQASVISAPILYCAAADNVIADLPGSLQQLTSASWLIQQTSIHHYDMDHSASAPVLRQSILEGLSQLR